MSSSVKINTQLRNEVARPYGNHHGCENGSFPRRVDKVYMDDADPGMRTVNQHHHYLYVYTIRHSLAISHKASNRVTVIGHSNGSPLYPELSSTHHRRQITRPERGCFRIEQPLTFIVLSSTIRESQPCVMHVADSLMGTVLSKDAVFREILVPENVTYSDDNLCLAAWQEIDSFDPT
jgi:hypothetical protein